MSIQSQTRYKTMGELMSELRARLGFVSVGMAAKNNDPLIESFLRRAHEYVFGELEPPALRKLATIKVQANSHLYDWHNDDEDEDIDPGRVLAVWLGGAVPKPLGQGIRLRPTPLETGEPERYDHLNGQIELYPVPAQEYDLVVEYTNDQARFEQHQDRCSVPDELVFHYALATAKAHYRHPDAQAAAAAFQMLLSKAKMRNHENNRYFVDVQPKRDARVVRTLNGYSLSR